MPTYLLEKVEEFKSKINTLLLFNPKMSGVQMVESLKKNGLELDYEYVLKLMGEVHTERKLRYDEMTKQEAMAEIENLGLWLINELRRIHQEEGIVYSDEKKGIKTKIIAQANRIKAIQGIFDIAQKLMNLKMDMGIFERQLGHFTGGVDVTALLGVIQKYEQDRNKTERGTNLDTLAPGSE